MMLPANKREEKAVDILSKALESALKQFTEDEQKAGILLLARYAMGYLGARYDIAVS